MILLSVGRAPASAWWAQRTGKGEKKKGGRSAGSARGSGKTSVPVRDHGGKKPRQVLYRGSKRAPPPALEPNPERADAMLAKEKKKGTSASFFLIGPSAVCFFFFLLALFFSDRSQDSICSLPLTSLMYVPLQCTHPSVCGGISAYPGWESEMRDLRRDAWFMGRV